MSSTRTIELPKPKLTTNYRDHEHHVGRKGDLTVSLVYAKVDRNNDPEGCLKIEHRTGRRVLVPMTGMWRWNEPQFMAELSGRAARALYGFVTMDDCKRVLDCVIDFLQDLKDHKPDPGDGRTREQFLEDCDREGLRFWYENNSGRKEL